MATLPVRKGIRSTAITNIPDTWSKEWFRDFVNRFMVQMDPKNGVGFASSGVNQNTQLTGQVDPSTVPATAASGNMPVLAKGNVMPFAQNQSFTYTSTTTSVTLSWSVYLNYRPDGTSFSVTAGSQTVNGLSANTTYYGYAYVTEANTGAMQFAANLPAQVGTPDILFPSTATQQQLAPGIAAASILGNIYQGKVTGVTPAGGTGGGGGGGGGYGGCPHPRQIVRTRDRYVQARDLRPGDALLTPDGYREIVSIALLPRHEWISVTFDSGVLVTVTADHRFIQPDDGVVTAGALRLGTIVRGAARPLRVVALELLEEDRDCVALELEAPHVYYFTGDGPLNHNIKP